jgi:putative peptidoglycan lipid II flippase
MLSRKTVMRNTVKIGSFTLASRILGVIRELLTASYLGVGLIPDSFFTAFKIPNTLRKTFAEGSISSAFIPTYVKVKRTEGNKIADSLMSFTFLIIQSIVVILCALTMWKAAGVIRVIAPGFPPEQIEITAGYLRILMPFIFFISSSALLAGALQASGYFFVPAFAPVLLNLTFIAGLALSMFFGLSVETFCFFVLIGGALQLLFHLVAYSYIQLRFGSFHPRGYHYFRQVLGKFFLCLSAMNEINFFISTSFASFLPHGSISLIHYANRFMGIPQGVFVAALVSVLLPYFSHISSYAPKRLNFYLLESSKLIFWVTVPVTIVMGFFAKDIFLTLFLSAKFSYEQAIEAGNLLLIFLSGLTCLALNKIILNMYYALHATGISSIIALTTLIFNAGLNFIFMPWLSTYVLVLTFTLAAILQTALLLIVLRYKFHFKFYGSRFFSFAVRYGIQLCVIVIPTFIIYYLMVQLISSQLPVSHAHFFLQRMGLWLWIAPLFISMTVLLIYTRKKFGISLYFLD